MPDLQTRIKAVEDIYSVHIECLQEVTSTNDSASSAVRKHGDIIWAERQTKGRGQRGNSWESATGKNLTFSVVIHPQNLSAENQFYISKTVSIAMVEALSELGIPAEIKWPNDIYIGDRKVAGILIENDLQGTHIIKSILGIGLNVNQSGFDSELPNPVSLYLAAEKEFDRVDVLGKIVKHLFPGIKKMNLGNFSVLDEKYDRYLYRKEGIHLFQEPGGNPFEASIKKILPSGELVLQLADGTAKGYFFKEVEFIIKSNLDDITF